MVFLSFEDWQSQSSAHNEAVKQCAWLDQYCARTEWTAAAFQHLCPGRNFVGVTDGENFLTFAGPVEREGGLLILEPTEAMWGLGASIIGTGAVALFDETVASAGNWNAILVTGIEKYSCCEEELLKLQGVVCQDVGTTSRIVAQLDEGFEHYWQSRSRNLRKSVQRSLKAFSDIGGRVELQSGPVNEETWRRIISVERRSWKGEAKVGMADMMSEFYRPLAMSDDADVDVQVLFACLEEADIGYVLGTKVGNSYRGLQFAYDNAYRNLGVGNVMQYRQIESVSAAGVTSYDLGTDMAYKERWANSHTESRNLLVIPRQALGG